MAPQTTTQSTLPANPINWLSGLSVFRSKRFSFYENGHKRTVARRKPSQDMCCMLAKDFPSSGATPWVCNQELHSPKLSFFLPNGTCASCSVTFYSADKGGLCCSLRLVQLTQEKLKEPRRKLNHRSFQMCEHISHSGRRAKSKKSPKPGLFTCARNVWQTSIPLSNFLFIRHDFWP